MASADDAPLPPTPPLSRGMRAFLFACKAFVVLVLLSPLWGAILADALRPSPPPRPVEVPSSTTIISTESVGHVAGHALPHLAKPIALIVLGVMGFVLASVFQGTEASVRWFGAKATRAWRGDPGGRGLSPGDEEN